MAVASLDVVSNEQLINEDCGQELGAIVVQPAMPNLVMQLKQSLEVIVKRLDRFGSAGIDSPKPLLFKSSASGLA